MLNRELLTATIAGHGDVLRHQPISEAKIIPDFLPRQLLVGRINDKNSIARKRTYAETLANYVTPRVAPQIAIATHVYS